METTIKIILYICCINIGIMEKDMETTIGLGHPLDGKAFSSKRGEELKHSWL